MNSDILTRMVAMRDGAKLHTVVYLPEPGARRPVLLVRTPYSARDSLPAPDRDYAEKGIVRVFQDCRGTGRSEGVLYPWRPEADDGEDCLRWISAQPWCDGRVAMTGGSYPGATQWLASFSAHPALVGIAPHVAPFDCHESPHYIGGAFCLKLSMEWGMGNHQRNGGYPPMKIDWEKLAWHLPLKDIATAAGLRPIDFWNDWLAHGDDDAYWRTVDVGTHVHRITAPAYISGGWFDIYARATLQSFAAMRSSAGGGKARAFTRCIIGPWVHGGLTGTMECGIAALQDGMNRTRARFLENILGDPDADPLPDEPPLRYFEMGSNEWRASDTWPVKGVKQTEYFLHGTAPANSRFGGGRLDTTAPRQESPDTFVYDPRRPVPTNGGCVICLPGGVLDQAQLEERADILVFSTDALTEDVTVVGPVLLILYAATSAPDTDFTAKLVDVYPDGRALNLCDGIVRARYRTSTARQELVTPGEVLEYRIDCWDTANGFRAGHRIRVEVSSSNFPRFDRNPNTGHALGADDELRVATQVVRHDAEYPSRLVLPVLTGAR